MSKYIIKKHNDGWTWDFESSDKFKIKPPEGLKFENKADIKAHLKELKFDPTKLEFKDEDCFYITSREKTFAICSGVKKDDENIIKKQICAGEITWENPEDDPANKDKKDDTTPNDGPAGS